MKHVQFLIRVMIVAFITAVGFGIYAVAINPNFQNMGFMSYLWYGLCGTILVYGAINLVPFLWNIEKE